ncbi:helix-turn-helix domain-containing protein [Cryobacterium aureum]|uniref:helix-turn-helix domain-containing protein n=1 Tax=Cryobacterium aureum TaxID=995037 RepID=UPI0011E4D731|nr:helix-turn-helix transcriptional regulator [Cryobacterium aureum]
MSSGGVTEPGPLTVAVAAILKRAFHQTSVSQEMLGVAVGISQSQLSKYLRGIRVLDVDQLDDLCFALHLDITEVMREAAIVARRD